MKLNFPDNEYTMMYRLTLFTFYGVKSKVNLTKLS